MRGYVAAVCVSAVIAALADILSPKEHRKYIRILLGFLVLSVILSPLEGVGKIKLEPIRKGALENSEAFLDSVSEKLRENIEADIAERMDKEFGIALTAAAELEIDGEGKILGVKRSILSRKIPEKALKRLKEVYGCDRIEY